MAGKGPEGGEWRGGKEVTGTVKDSHRSLRSLVVPVTSFSLPSSLVWFGLRSLRSLLPYRTRRGEEMSDEASDLSTFLSSTRSISVRYVSRSAHSRWNGKRKERSLTSLLLSSLNVCSHWARIGLSPRSSVVTPVPPPFLRHERGER